ncbi:MAG: carbohydrate kinase, partial [Alphaproteobacteria bacterium]|nr:carbohydrate kinase [Alphaproteobacteria bacterium]
MARILAFDVGGSGLRAAVVGADGSVGGVAIRPVASALDGTSHEIDADAWWRLLPDAAAEALAGGTADAVAVTGMTRTQVLTDAAGRPVRAAFGFRDARAAAEVDAAAGALATSP